LKHFQKAISPGFDPDIMFQKIGLANQTTMYKKETRAIGQLLQKAMMKKYGPVDIKAHYMEFDTICDATQVRLTNDEVKTGFDHVGLVYTNPSLLLSISLQERQDAVHELTEKTAELGLDFILVIGGFDSSNTAHLLEIPQIAGVRSFHINRAECISADNTITHRTMAGEIVTEPFLLDMDKEIVMGVTSGASTPDKAVQDSLSQIFLLKKLHDGQK
jgi:4-hydroxy-3-methylbut-2-enyl diphosphate reductase